jgi:choline kinase
MTDIIMAAGVGKRLGGSFNIIPKCLLEFAGRSLLQRHLQILRHCGITEIVIGVGYQSEQIEAAIAAYRDIGEIETVYNPHYQQGSMVTLWTLRDHITSGDELLLMDADVLYDQRLLERLLASAHANCFLLDRDLEPGGAGQTVRSR